MSEKGSMSETKRPRGRPKGLKPPKRQYPLKLDEETRAQLAAAAYWTRQSANAIMEQGIGIVLRRLQQQHNAGRPFPPKPSAPTAAPAPGASEDTGGNGAKGSASGGKPKRRRAKGGTRDKK
jgi:hypothetical protein